MYRVIERELMALRDDAQAAHLMRFFKTGKGEYGEGDRFLGLRVPQTRAIVGEYRNDAQLSDAEALIASPWHEIRLAGFLLLIELAQRARRTKDETARRAIVDRYLSLIHRGNNWDLVDVIAPKLLGQWIADHPEDEHLLYQLAAMEGQLWHQRVAIVSTWTLMRHDRYDATFTIAERFLTHPHDLIHKATGWMLREAGKHGALPRLMRFLDTHATRMPRTMLRYSLEKLPATVRASYMSR